MPRSPLSHRHFLAVCLCFASPWMALAQQATTTRPTVGLRTADPSPILLHGGTVIADPKSNPQQHDVLIRGTTIVEIGDEIDAPSGTLRIDVSGKQIYAGLIDAMREIDVPTSTFKNDLGYWNKNITPQARACDAASEPDSTIGKLRSQGITTQMLAPRGGIMKGTSCVVLLVDPKHPQRLLRSDVFQHATITVPRGKSRDRYPNSPMGATAIVRQSLYDAIWYRDAKREHRIRPTSPRPEPNTGLDALLETIQSGTFVFDAANERMAARAIAVANEFSLPIILRGSGNEYRGLDQIAAADVSVLLPVDFPDAPDVTTAESIRRTPQVDWMHWHFAPENPARLNQAGVSFCLTTDSLKDPGQFLKKIRLAIDRGLDPSVALAAMTTTPAKILGIEQSNGRVDAGMLANLVITDGDLFDQETKVIETWVAGQRFEIKDNATPDHDSLVGSWKLDLPTDGDLKTVTLKFETKKKMLKGTITDPSIELTKMVRQRDRLSASVRFDSLGDDFSAGVYQLTILTIDDQSSSKDATLFASLVSPDGSEHKIVMRRIEEGKKEKDAEEKSEPEAEQPEKDEKKNEDSQDDVLRESIADIELVHPLGAYGLIDGPEQAKRVLFRGATVWTSGPDGKIANGDVLVKRGKIAAVGAKLKVGKDCRIIDVRGKHITPGLIDCHSHAATDGGINESGQAVTSEVRIGDFIDNTDISIYRQLAGGVTTVNVLHGSANPIGGQNQVLKYRWGQSMDEMKFRGAPAGIKFALGENVKRNPGRYPNTRMGVEQLLRDQFLAARQYDADHQAWANGDRGGLPPRRDLQLDAIVEIQKGRRWVHCHSYRQDEIVATLGVLDEFHVQIGTLQHILEGYKVADRMAAHGAMASSFADWWAYKFEVFDAIPYNGVLMHDAGVVVSFNSDDAELARHLNTEAAKATKYGGVPEEEALKFVTLNPAKQLRIDDRVGSIEVGKDADLVVWSGRPLSTTSRCEQTWVDGRQYFSLEEDAKLRQRDQRWRSQLIQLANGGDKEKKNGHEKDKKKDSEEDDKDEPEKEEDRWLRYDEFCNARGEQREVN